ncbi:MAG: M20/M25/M40 family metallo-hydrolase [Candidatus Latescibacter sp.]|nr:M20/M25/M40 family metallo-hydrolase [Candidatus Latescibacter sp.]
MTDIKAALRFIDDDELIQVTRDLVAIPSLTHHEGRGMVDFYERWFRDLGIPIRVYPYDAERANFFADYGAVSGKGRFLFNGHQDVKPVEGMTVDPFAGNIVEGRMYGRGTCDMKGGLAAVLCAYKALVRAGIKPRGGISFFSDIEEEWGGAAGYYWARDQGLLGGYEGMISAEGTGLEVQIGNRGCFATCFEFKGRSAHSGIADKGVNAIIHAARFITEFVNLPYLKVSNPIFGNSTCNFEKIEGGLYLAAVPDRCIVCLDSRLIPETPPELVQGQVDVFMERMRREFGMDVSEADEPKGWRDKSGKLKAEFIASDHPLTLLVAEAFRKATGKEAVIGGCPGVAFSMVMIEMGIPSVLCGPGNIAQAHTADEWVELDQIFKAARIYTTLMAGM